MTFNIGNQNAVNINNVGGDQTVADQSGVMVTVDDARDATRELRRALTAVPLDAQTAAIGRQSVDEVETELAQGAPDPRRIAPIVLRLTKSLAAAGALAAATTGLVAPLATIASWLGALGAPVLQLLGR